jgi:hypothetical protein
MSFPGTTILRQHDVLETTTSQKHRLGTVGVVDGNRHYVYSKAGEALTAGKLTMQADVVANHDIDLAVAAASAGATTLTITLDATAATKDQYKDGYVFFNDLEEEGHFYRIKSHPAISASAAGVFTLEDEDGLITAITASQQVGLMAAPTRDIEIFDANDIDGAPIGIPNVDIASGSFGWVQFQGWCNALIQGTPAKGSSLMASNGTDGALEILAEGSATMTAVVANLGNSDGVDGEYRMVQLLLSA